LNAAVRQELKANGAIGSEDHRLRVLIQRQEMTGAERSWASRYEISDVVRYARGSKSAGIESGEYGTVVGINSTANVLILAATPAPKMPEPPPDAGKLPV